MTDSGKKFSRVDRQKELKREDRTLNILIIAVIVALIITAFIIFKNGSNESDKMNKPDPSDTEGIDNKDSPESNEDISISSDEADAEDNGITIEKEESGLVTYLYENDDIIEKTIVDPAWKPIGTTQTGEHESLYKIGSVDWNEKLAAIAGATGLTTENTITWWIKTGEGPDKSIGIVSSIDKTEKYRVYLEWIEQEGWKTVKLDVLKTLDFDYKN